MNRNNVVFLRSEAERVAKLFSDTTRQLNFNAESFSVYEVRPLSDSTAAVIMKKNTGLYAFVFFQYIKGGDYWQYSFPTDSHIVGMSLAGSIKAEVERLNYEARMQIEVKQI